jgi:hypothetical protein
VSGGFDSVAIDRKVDFQALELSSRTVVPKRRHIKSTLTVITSERNLSGRDVILERSASIAQ